MLTILERALFSSTLTAVLVLCPLLSAQVTQDMAPAPVPPQILAAKKVFIANAPGDLMAPSIGGNNVPYDAFYTAVKSWGYYELVSSPAEADLVFQISFTNSLAGVSGTSLSGCLSSTNPLLRLVIVDPKTQTRLWWFAEQTQKRRVFEKPIDAFRDAISRLIGDVKRLTATPDTVSPRG